MERRVRRARQHAVLRLGARSIATSCCRAASSCVRAEEVTNRFRERVGNAMKIYFVVPDYYETRPKACMNGWGAVFLSITADGLALPCHEARMLPGLDVPERARPRPALDLARFARLQRVSRRRVDEGAVPQLSGEGQGLRRLPLPGLHADRRCRQRRSRVRQVAAPRWSPTRPSKRARVPGTRVRDEALLFFRDDKNSRTLSRRSRTTPVG